MSSQQKSPKEKNKSPLRFVNAVVASCILCFFFIHACLGTGIILYPALPTNLIGLIWLGLAGIVVHIALSARTTYEMFTDTIRPPSPEKRRHMILKWCTGAVLLLAVFIHLPLDIKSLIGLNFGVDIVNYGPLSFCLLLLMVAALLWHLFVAAKSLFRDLGHKGARKTPFRVVVFALGLVLCAVLATQLFR